MDTAITTALSGMNAASKRLQASASNTANVTSTAGYNEAGQLVNKPYEPVEVVQQSVQPAGTLADIRKTNAPPIEAFDPSSPLASDAGVVQYPAVDQATEAVNQIIARNSFEANLKTVQAANQMIEQALNLTE